MALRPASRFPPFAPLRTPVAIGLFVLLAVVLCVAALAHLAGARKATGHRVLWALVVMAVPLLGPIAYLAFGRTLGDDVMEEADDEVPYTPVP